MSKYECNLCFKQFKTKSNYSQHLYRSKPCIDINNSEKCQYCSKTFSHKYNRLRHENDTCSERINQDMKKTQETIIEDITKKNKNLEETNKHLKEKLMKLEIIIKIEI